MIANLMTSIYSLDPTALESEVQFALVDQPCSPDILH